MVSRVLPVPLIACLLCASSSAAQTVIVGGVVTSDGQASGLPARDTRPASGHAILRGRVLSDDGQPLRQAVVRILTAQIRNQRTASTDRDGRYEFTDLPAGSYSVFATKPAYVDSSYGQPRPNTPGKPVTLTDRQIVDNIDIRLMKGGVITGRVVDEFGEPMPNASVSPIRQQFFQGQRRLTPVGARAQTNDLGEYRVFGLAPGQYYVSASAQPTTLGMPTANGVDLRGQTLGYATALYPAAPGPATAQRVTVTAAQTISGIDIALTPVPLASVSGSAVDAQGMPMTAGSVFASTRNGVPGATGAGGPLRPDGSFTIANIPPGDYTLRASAPGGPQAGQQFASANVTIDGAGLTGVRLAPVAPVIIRGRVLFDDPAAAQSLSSSKLRLNARILNSEDSLLAIGLAGGLAVQLEDDFTFAVKTPATLIGFAGTPSTAPEWQIKSIRANGVDVTDTGVEVGRAGLNDVEIEMTNRSQLLSGTVADSKGQPIRDYGVALFSTDRSRWGLPANRFFAIGRPGDDARFKVSTLPPGEYYAIALDTIAPADWEDPENLERLSRQAQTFVLAPGDNRTLDLRLVTP